MRKIYLLLILCCFYLPSIAQVSLNYQWSAKPKYLAGGKVTVFGSVQHKIDQNIFVLGKFDGRMDLDGIDTTITLIPNGTNDFFLAKYSNTGQLINAVQFGSMEDEGLNSTIILSGDGKKLFVVWRPTATFDIDPSPAVYNALANKVYMGIYDNNLNLLNVIDFSLYALNFAITSDNQGNIFIASNTSGSFNADLNGGNQYLYSTSDNIALVKYDSSFNFISGFTIGFFHQEAMNGIRVNDNGEVILSGSFDGPLDFDPSASDYILTPVGSDNFIAKYSNNLSFIYAKKLSGSSSAHYSYMQLDNANNIYYMCHQSNDSIDVDLGANVVMAKGPFFVKYDSNGALLFCKQYTGSFAVKSFNVTDSNKIVLTAITPGTYDLDPSVGGQYNPGQSNREYFSLIFFDLGGNFIDAKQIENTGTLQINSVFCRYNKVVIAADFIGTYDLDPSANSVYVSHDQVTSFTNSFVASYDLNGNYEMSSQIGNYLSSFQESDSKYTAIASDTIGNIYAGGLLRGVMDFSTTPGVAMIDRSQDNSWNSVAFLAKYDSTGNILFYKRLNGGASKIVVDKIGNVIVMTSNAITKYTSSGTLIYQKVFYNLTFKDLKCDESNNIVTTGICYAGTVDFDPSAAVAGYTIPSGTRAFLAKYNTSGDYQFGKIISMNVFDPIKGLMVNIGRSNKIILTGIFRNTADFDFSAATYNVTPNSFSEDIFIAEYDSLAGFISARNLGTSVYEGDYRIALDNQYNIYIGGRTSGQMDVDFGSGTQIVTKDYIVKYDENFNYKYSYDSLPFVLSNISLDNNVPYIAGYTSTHDFRVMQIDSLEKNYALSYTVGQHQIDTLICGNNSDFYFMDETIDSIDADPSSGVDTKFGSYMLLAKFKRENCAANLVPYLSLSDSTPCVRQMVTMSVLNSDTTVSLNSYEFGSNLSSSFMYTSSGIYTRYYTTVGGCINFSNSFDSINVDVKPYPIVGVGSSSNRVCRGDSIMLWGTGNAINYTINGMLDSSYFSPPSTSLTTYTVTAISAFGCQDTALKALGIFTPEPQVGITVLFNPSPCEGGQSKVHAAGSSGTTSIINSNIIDNQFFTPDSTMYVVAQCVSAAMYGGCTTKDSVLITVNPKPIIQINNDTSICVGQSIVINGISDGATSSWDNGIQNGQTITPLGNTDYIFSSVSSMGCFKSDTLHINATQCVWPGDADDDDLVGTWDMLEIGLRYGATGSARTSISNNWDGYNCVDWGTNIGTYGSNIKHTDCNGDGIINYDDTLAVNLNFSFQHVSRIAGNRYNDTIPSVYFSSNQQTYGASDLVEIDVYFGTEIDPINNFYGGVFYFFYPDNQAIIPNSLSFAFTDSSWIGNLATNEIKMVQNYGPPYSMIEAAICKIDHLNSNGYGKIGTIKFMTDNPDSTTILNFFADWTETIDSVGSYLSLMGSEYSITVSPSVGLQNHTSNSNISIYPNPNNGSFTLSNLNTREEYNLEVKDVLGRTVYTDVIKSNSSKANIKLNQAAGVYWLQISSKQGGVEVHKVVVE